MTIESGGTTLEDGALSADGILDILSDDTDTTENDKGKEDKEKDEKSKDKGPGKEVRGKEDEEGDEGEEEDEGKEVIKLEDQDDLEFLHVNRRDILKAYPDIFKKFPSIEKSIYREQQYAELYPTLQEARDAKESVDNYARFESSLLNGDISDVLNTVKNTDANAFERITETFLPTLNKLDKAAHASILSQVLKSAAITMYGEGKTRNNENLQLAAQILHEFAFGNGQITPYKFKHDIEVRENPREQELMNREQGFMKQQFDVAINDVSGRAENVIKSTVDKHIDPKGLMTPYVKGKASKEVLEEVDRAIKGDRSFSAILDRLWERALDSNFSEQTKIKIKNAILAKSQTVLPDIIRKIRADALKGYATRNDNGRRADKDDEEEVVDKPAKRDVAGPRNSSSKKDGRGMKTADFFLQD